jgi:hypothetical protein
VAGDAATLCRLRRENVRSRWDLEWTSRSLGC